MFEPTAASLSQLNDLLELGMAVPGTIDDYRHA